MYYGARYYDPSIGLFVMADRLTQNARDPQLLNPYSYVRNNPYKFIDPDGRTVFLASKGLESFPVSTKEKASHTYLVVTPDNPEEFGGYYEDYAESFTLGGTTESGLPWGNLIIVKDQPTDKSPGDRYIDSVEVPRPEEMTDTEFIKAVIDLYEDYQSVDEKVKYGPFALRRDNSNVVTTSLLMGAGIPKTFFSSINTLGNPVGLGKENKVISGLSGFSRSQIYTLASGGSVKRAGSTYTTVPGYNGIVKITPKSKK